MENIVLKSLKERRSIRSYQGRQVDEDALQAILEAGTYAATGMNRQVPIIVCVQDEETIEQLRRMNAEIMGNPLLRCAYRAYSSLHKRTSHLRGGRLSGAW